MKYSLLIILLAFGNQVAAQIESEVLFETDSSVYLLLTEPTSWLVAESRAQELGGWLVTLHNEDENTAVFEAFQASESTDFEEGYFIGLRQDESLPGFNEPQGGWVWGASQGAVVWSNWDTSEPNQGGNTGVENCGSVKDLNSGLGVWNDVSCSYNINKAVVEVPTLVVGCTAPPACNYDDSATVDNGSCDYASCHCLGGTVWDQAIGGCVPVLTAETVCGEGTVWNAVSQSCVVINGLDTNFDGCVGMTDLLDLLSFFGTCAEENSEAGNGEWSCGDPVHYHGYDYQTVLIGEQCWFAENLRTQLTQDGTELELAIPVNPNPAPNACYQAWGDYSTVDFTYQATPAFGFGYTWDALSAYQLCPAGWSVPSDLDFMTLELFIGMDSLEVHSYDYGGWARGAEEELALLLKDPVWNSDNWSAHFYGLGFNWRPTGHGDSCSGWLQVEEGGYLWTSTFQSGNGVARNLIEGNYGIGRTHSGTGNYHMIRCLKDSE